MVSSTVTHKPSGENRMSDRQSEPQEIAPFKVIERGEDTVINDQVVFADFSPRVLPADAPDEVAVDEVTVPKEESAPEPVPSQESTETTELQTSDTTVQVPADEGDGLLSQNESGKPDSSSDPKTG